ncbi:MAG: hypothetical protein SGARI_005748 [Bacillariaceae sp.]
MARGPDALDVITGVVAAGLGAAAYATYKGKGVPAVSTVTALFAAAYFTAPRRKFPTAEAVCPDVSGKVAIVTGATSGIGVDTAGVLFGKGANLYIAARNPSKLEATKKDLVARFGGDSAGEIHILVCDLSDLKSVQTAAKTFLKAESKLDILINNAGIMALPERTPTKQGLESQVGVCHVGHFYLTKLLLPAIRKAKGPYGNAKCSNLLFARGLHKRHKITAFSVNPGGIHTGLQTHVDPWTMFKWTIVTPFFFKSTSQGAATSILCATSPDVVKDSGEYFDNCAVVKDAVKKVEDESFKDADEKLWKQTEGVLKSLGF